MISSSTHRRIESRTALADQLGRSYLEDVWHCTQEWPRLALSSCRIHAETGTLRLPRGLRRRLHRLVGAPSRHRSATARLSAIGLPISAAISHFGCRHHDRLTGSPFMRRAISVLRLSPHYEIESCSDGSAIAVGTIVAAADTDSTPRKRDNRPAPVEMIALELYSPRPPLALRDADIGDGCALVGTRMHRDATLRYDRRLGPGHILGSSPRSNCAAPHLLTLTLMTVATFAPDLTPVHSGRCHSRKHSRRASHHQENTETARAHGTPKRSSSCNNPSTDPAHADRCSNATRRTEQHRRDSADLSLLPRRASTLPVAIHSRRIFDWLAILVSSRSTDDLLADSSCYSAA